MNQLRLGKTKDEEARFSPQDGCGQCHRTILRGKKSVAQYLYRIKNGRRVPAGVVLFCNDVCLGHWQSKFFAGSPEEL